MEGSDETGVLHRIHPSSGDYSFSSLNQPHHQINTHNQMAMNLTAEGGHKRPGIPPCHPHFPPAAPQSQITMANKMTGHHQMGSQNFAVGPSHSRSLSQHSFFSFDHLPPLSPSPYVRESPSTTSIGDMSMEDKVYSNNAQQALPPAFAAAPSTHANESLPPRRGHRRSSSDIPLGFASTVQPSSLQIPSGFPSEKYGGQRVVNMDKTKPIQLTTKREFGSSGFEESTDKKTEGETVDDLFSAYMNLDNIDTMNSSSVEDKDMDSSRASGTKTNDSSENEVESSIDGNCNANAISGGTRGEKKDRGKRSATGDIAPTSSRHFRSLSMDSFMGNLNFNDMSPKLPPSPGMRSGQHSPSDSFDGDSSKFSMEFGGGDFSAVEMKKIMANEKLAEIAMADPKRAKRILANRQSAARSKERKLRYIAELEHKVQTLQTEATTLSAQLTLLQRDSAGLTTQNNELKFRLQSMEQQAQLRDALNEALTAEVQRLKIATARIGGESPQQLMLKDNYLPNQASQFNMYQMQQTQSHQSHNQNQNQNQQVPPTQHLMQNQSPASQPPQEEVGMSKS